MGQSKMHTDFAPAERALLEEVNRQFELFNKNSPLLTIIDTVQNLILILNKERQVVFASKSLFKLLKIDNIDEIYSLRPGEILQCVHAFENEAGCGTTESCSTCGVAKAILNTQQGICDNQECRIITKDKGDALDLKISTSPVIIDNEHFVIVTIADISDEKRRRALERIFFHDVLNTAGGLRGIAELIKEADDPEELNEYKEILHPLTERLIDEIQEQRQLSGAENNELSVNITVVNSFGLLYIVAEEYKNHLVTKGRVIVVRKDSDIIDFMTDVVILRRIIGNMLKNSLEASPDDGIVTLECRKADNEIVFSVHNSTFMPRDVQLQIFQRSFSTKGSGHGLGTYSMKLLSERYLNGKVSFVSTEENGTTFYCNLPL
ncbi:MAG: ATP-binding protein [Ignavibacteria bacterium]